MEETKALTKEEFAVRYITRSCAGGDRDPRKLLRLLIEHKFAVVKCGAECSDPNCRGWGMWMQRNIEARKQLGLPVSVEVYPLEDLDLEELF